VPANLRKEHKIDEKFDRVVRCFHELELSELEGEIFELEDLVTLLLKIVKKCEKIEQRIKENEAALSDNGKKAFLLNEGLLHPGKSGDLNEITYMIHSMNILFDSLNGLPKEAVSTCLDMIASGKCDDAIDIIHKSKPESEDMVASLKSDLGLIDVRNIDILRDMSGLGRQ